jgi:hypothetical protein
LILLWGLHRFRLHRISREFNARLEGRVNKYRHVPFERDAALAGLVRESRIGVIDAILEAGLRVPGEIALIGRNLYFDKSLRVPLLGCGWCLESFLDYRDAGFIAGDSNDGDLAATVCAHAIRPFHGLVHLPDLQRGGEPLPGQFAFAEAQMCHAVPVQPVGLSPGILAIRLFGAVERGAGTLRSPQSTRFDSPANDVGPWR